MLAPRVLCHRFQQARPDVKSVGAAAGALSAAMPAIEPASDCSVIYGGAARSLVEVHRGAPRY